jgi:hypothetical protein
MAAFNSTQTNINTAGRAFDAFHQLPFQIEKISCSDGVSSVSPAALLGKRIRYAEVLLMQIDIGDGDAFRSYISSGVVLAVNIGSPEHGIETSLLIQQDGYKYSDYADISHITVLEVLG